MGFALVILKTIQTRDVSIAESKPTGSNTSAPNGFSETNDASFIGSIKNITYPPMSTSGKIKKVDGFNGSRTFRAYKPEANFMLLKILDDDLSSSEIFEKAIKKGLMIRDCSDFIGLSDRFIRFCFLLPDEDDKLVDLLLS